MHVQEEDVTHIHMQVNMQGVEVVKPMPKVNPFGDAKPREVLLHDKGLDWKKIDLELERCHVERYFHPYFRYYMREIRTIVYSQFLESYKSITIDEMAKAFGVTVDFIDIALSRFVTAGKLHCKIDKVAGVLETNRPDAKNVLYQSTIKKGDFLYILIQKLSRVIDP